MVRHLERIVTNGVTPDADRPMRRSADGPLAHERLMELRRRIRDGVYDTRAVVEEVARRILRREGF